MILIDVPFGARSEVMRAMTDFVTESVTNFLKPIESNWQPSDFLPDSSNQDDFFSKVNLKLFFLNLKLKASPKIHFAEVSINPKTPLKVVTVFVIFKDTHRYNLLVYFAGFF